MDELELDQQVEQTVCWRIYGQVRLARGSLEQNRNEVLTVIALLELRERVDRVLLALLNSFHYLFADFRAATHGLRAVVLEPILIFGHDNRLEQVCKLLL